MPISPTRKGQDPPDPVLGSPCCLLGCPALWAEVLALSPSIKFPRCLRKSQELLPAVPKDLGSREGSHLLCLAALTLGLGLWHGSVWFNSKEGRTWRQQGPRVLTVRRSVWPDSLCGCRTRLGSRASGTPAAACPP